MTVNYAFRSLKTVTNLLGIKLNNNNNEGNQLPVSAARGQHGLQICSATFIWFLIGQLQGILKGEVSLYC